MLQQAERVEIAGLVREHEGEDTAKAEDPKHPALRKLQVSHAQWVGGHRY